MLSAALLDRRVPLLGVCLGAQMVAKAAGARVGPAAEPEIGWCESSRPQGGRPVLGVLPARFPAFQWHFYAFDVPAGAAELARSRVCPQAFRLGEPAWAVQFHPEVTREIVAGWVAEAPDEVPGGADALLAETDQRMRRVDAPRRGLVRRLPRGAERFARRRLALQRQLGVARPLVPRAEVVPRVVAGGAERDHGSPEREPEWQYVTTSAPSGSVPTSACTSSAGFGTPGAANSVETSTFLAPGMWPCRGSHG